MFSILSHLPKSRNLPFARALVDAFCRQPPADPAAAAAGLKVRITQAWIEQATIGIDALIEFRSALHRWQAQGHVGEAEFQAELLRLHQANFGDFFDNLMAVALVVEVTDGMRAGEGGPL